MKNQINNQKGISLIEVLVALSIGVIVIAGISTLVITSLDNTTYTKSENQATSYAQEGLEVVRQVAQSNYSSFVNTYGGKYCMGETLELIPPAEFGCRDSEHVLANIFTREIDITHSSPECSDGPTPAPGENISNTKLSVVVAWSDSRCRGQLYCHNVSLESCIVDTQTIPSPI